MLSAVRVALPVVNICAPEFNANVPVPALTVRAPEPELITLVFWVMPEPVIEIPFVPLLEVISLFIVNNPDDAIVRGLDVVSAEIFPIIFKALSVLNANVPPAFTVLKLLITLLLDKIAALVVLAVNVPEVIVVAACCVTDAAVNDKLLAPVNVIFPNVKAPELTSVTEFAALFVADTTPNKLLLVFDKSIVPVFAVNVIAPVPLDCEIAPPG